jgi:hypothetical protein
MDTYEGNANLDLVFRTANGPGTSAHRVLGDSPNVALHGVQGPALSLSATSVPQQR